MNPLYTEFKRKFSVSMYKNMGISLGQMSFLKDFVNDTRGDLYPLVAKSDDCVEQIEKNRYHLLGGLAERVFCQLFPFATYEVNAEKVRGEVGFVFRLPEVSASVVLVCGEDGTYFSYKCEEHTERIEAPADLTESTPWLVTLRPGYFDIYYRQNGIRGSEYVGSYARPLQ